ncbi:14c86993-a797-4164-a6a5-7306329da901 [Thermothielavioides terrestris]|uniref:14c86993-a797-4164-a6a5-7306329da901 n=1 Tax=Thermothielavioides terrestris TaxID=2587410 RepID=A0A446BH10_9PEZI|nr:14c86993-a797-4164-a6a5-7306329da901 [Thermothielavioides terrestris]
MPIPDQDQPPRAPPSATEGPPPPSPPSPTTTTAGGGGSAQDSFPTLFGIVLGAAVLLGLALALLIICVARRRARQVRQRRRRQAGLQRPHDDDAAEDADADVVITTSGSSSSSGGGSVHVRDAGGGSGASRVWGEGEDKEQSTDSALSEILRSTEKRLREGSISGTSQSNTDTASPTRAPHPREYAAPLSRARTPSPKKHVPSQQNTPGHQPQDSQNSISSEADSLVGGECPAPDAPSGLTSPSRSQKKQDAERQPPQTRSVRTSLSSDLSTLYSEDEMPDEVKKAIMPLEGLVVQPQQAARVGPPSMNDPFVTAPLLPWVSRSQSIGHGCQAKHSKSQDLFRATLHRSQCLRSMTAGQNLAQPQGLILAPGPVMHGAIQTSLPAIPPSRQASVTIPRCIQPYIASRASEPPPSPTKVSPTGQSPSGPLFLRVTKTSTLSTIPSLPPPAVPSFSVPREREQRITPHSPIRTSQTAGGEALVRRSPALRLPSTERSSAPPSPTRPAGDEVRLSLVPPPEQLQDLHRENRTSASSSVYSQATSPLIAAAAGAIELNRAHFRANASLYPAPLSPHGRGPSPLSKLSSSQVPGNDNDDKHNADASAAEEGQNAEHEGHDDNDGGGGGEDNEDEDTPLAIGNTIASLRRMNSGISTASSLQSIPDRDPSPSPSPSPKPDRPVVPAIAPGAVAAGSSSAGAGGGDGNGAGVGQKSIVDREQAGAGGDGQAHRKSIGARNYFTMGAGGQRQSRRGGKENNAGGATADGGFKVAAGEFTFEMSNPSVAEKGGLGLREGSAANVKAALQQHQQHPQQSQGQMLSLAWKPVPSELRGSQSPARASMRSVDSLGLYDRQGFLISASPARGVSPSGLRV